MSATEPSSVDDVGVDGSLDVDDGEARDLSGRTASGLGWTYGAAGVSAVMQVVYTAVTSRYLTPTEVGLFAAAAIVVNFTRYLSELGTGQALIQKPTLSREDVRAGSTLGIGLGLLSFALVALAAGPISRTLLAKPDVTPVLRWLALSFFLTSAQTTSQALIRRQLRFRELGIIDVAAFFFGYIALGCTSAILGAGVWSLVLAVNGAALFALVGRYLVVRHPVVPVRGMQHYRGLLSFGVRTSGVNFLNYVSNNVDTIAVLRYATEALLGIYNRAFQMVTLSMTYLTQSLQRVLFSGLSRIQGDPARLGRVFSRIIGVVAFIILPVSAGLAAAAVEVVEVVLGLPRWEQVIPLVPFLCLAAASQGLSSLASATTEARAELNRMLAIQVATLVGMVAMMSFVVGGELVRYAWVLAAGEVARHLMLLGLVRRTTGLPARELVAAYVPALVAAAAVAAGITGVRLLLVDASLPRVVVLLLEVVTGAVVLAAMLRLGPAGRVRQEIALRLGSLGVHLHSSSRAALVARVLLGGKVVTDAEQGGR